VLTVEGLKGSCRYKNPYGFGEWVWGEEGGAGPKVKEVGVRTVVLGQRQMNDEPHRLVVQSRGKEGGAVPKTNEQQSVAHHSKWGARSTLPVQKQMNDELQRLII
jgi:hypothetical protein